MKAELTIRNLQKRVSIRASQIARAARKILKAEGVRHAELSVVFVTDRKIKALNLKYLKRDRATDVLAFDLKDKNARFKKTVIGEIIISAETAAKNARRFKTSVKKELLLYVIHGILHLIGYDDHKPRDVHRIRRREEDLLKRIYK